MLEHDGEVFAKEVLREQFYPRHNQVRDLYLKRLNLDLDLFVRKLTVRVQCFLQPMTKRDLESKTQKTPPRLQ